MNTAYLTGINTAYLTEIKTLCNMLLMAGIPFSFETFDGIGYQVCYPNTINTVCSIICHKYSYGSENGLLEIMGLVEIEDDEVEGYLTAKEVFKRIQNHWENSEGHNRKNSLVFVSFKED